MESGEVAAFLASTAEVDYGELKEIAPDLPSEEEIGGEAASPADGWVTAGMEEFVAGHGYEIDTTGMTVTEIGCG